MRMGFFANSNMGNPCAFRSFLGDSPELGELAGYSMCGIVAEMGIRNSAQI